MCEFRLRQKLPAKSGHAKCQSLRDRPRILAGEFRGQRLQTLPHIRPSTSRFREVLFGILEGGRFTSPKGGWPLDHAHLLDVFAGSGALAFEALSRGAAQAILLERSSMVRTLLRKNADLLGLKSRVTIIAADAFAPPASMLPCSSLVLLDPPYHKRPAGHALAALWQAGWVMPGALCGIEYAYGSEVSAPACFQVLVMRCIGQSCLLLLRAPNHLG